MILDVKKFEKYIFDMRFHHEKHEIILFRKCVEGNQFHIHGTFLTLYNVSWKFTIRTEGYYTSCTHFLAPKYSTVDSKGCDPRNQIANKRSFQFMKTLVCPLENEILFHLKSH